MSLDDRFDGCLFLHSLLDLLDDGLLLSNEFVISSNLLKDGSLSLSQDVNLFLGSNFNFEELLSLLDEVNSFLLKVLHGLSDLLKGGFSNTAAFLVSLEDDKLTSVVSP